MTKHTKGPWMWDSDPIKGDPLNRLRYQVVARGKTVTQCYYSSSDEHAEHDARLIAAAPDLLEALKAAVDCGMVPTTSASEGGASKHSRQVRVADMIRAAISKAEGANT